MLSLHSPLRWCGVNFVQACSPEGISLSRSTLFSCPFLKYQMLLQGTLIHRKRQTNLLKADSFIEQIWMKGQEMGLHLGEAGS